MNEQLNNKCCDKCTHDSVNPCPDFIECINGTAICHESGDCIEKRKKILMHNKKEDLKIPRILIGTGTCGLGAGARKTLDAIRDYVRNNDVNAEIVEVGCIGLCSSEPIMKVQMPGKNLVLFEKVTEDKVAGILKGIMDGNIVTENLIGQYGDDKNKEWKDIIDLKNHPFFGPQMRIVLKNCGLIDPVSIEEYLAKGGYRAFGKLLKKNTPEEICEQVLKSGLRGRGGGGFLTGQKWKFALGVASDQKYLICNADEGDPGAFMDRAVIEGDPYRLLEGMAIAAYAIGATKAYVYIRAEYPLAIVRLEQAIEKSKEYGFLGNNILDSGMNLQIIIKKGAGAFVCGEETALIHSIEGKRGMPRPRPPFPAVSGLFGKPTIINNVETLANLPWIFEQGFEKFSAVGTLKSKGTKVFALSGKITRTGLVEVAMGTTVRDIVFKIGGGIPNGKKYKAVQIGGPSGGCIPDKHLDIEVDYESLKSVGAMMGSGGLVVMDEDTCMVDVAKFFMDFIQRESCGKCIPCREGTRRMLETLKSITERPKDPANAKSLERFRSVMYIKRLAETIKDTSLCGLGQTAPNPVLSTLNFFREEYEAHVFARKCPAGACTELIQYRISEEKCIGCGLCEKKCPTEAIKGVRKSPHYIVSEKCISCGACFDVCKFKAVVKE